MLGKNIFAVCSLILIPALIRCAFVSLLRRLSVQSCSSAALMPSQAYRTDFVCFIDYFVRNKVEFIYYANLYSIVPV